LPDGNEKILTLYNLAAGMVGGIEYTSSDV
jgi:hypothetical protein